MKLKVNPLVVAAALGLLGPAALADEDEVEVDRPTLAGVWKRSGGEVDEASARLGEEIQVIELEDRVVLHDGVGGPQGTWTVAAQGPARQELTVEGRRITRTFEASGDRLDVQVTVEDHGQRTVFHQTYQREV